MGSSRDPSNRMEEVRIPSEERQPPHIDHLRAIAGIARAADELRGFAYEIEQGGPPVSNLDDSNVQVDPPLGDYLANGADRLRDLECQIRDSTAHLRAVLLRG